MTEIVKIDPKDYGLTETRAKEVAATFTPMLLKMEELEDNYNSIIERYNDEGITPAVIKDAKVLRSRYVKIRTGTAKIHKEAKAFYLQGGRFIDGWKNAQLSASQGKEEKLLAIEKFHENQEKERIKKLQDERVESLEEFGDLAKPFPSNLGELSPAFWETFYEGVKAKYADHLKAEEARAEEAKKEKLRRDRLEQIAPYYSFFTSGDIQEDTAKKSMLGDLPDASFSKLISQLKESKAKHDEEQRRIAKENEVLRAQNETVKERLSARQKEEEDLKNKELLRQQQEKMKSDSDKMRDLINDLKELRVKYGFGTEANQLIYTGVKTLLGKIVEYIENKLSNG